MLYLAIICIIMAILSAVFWVIEAKPIFVASKNTRWSTIPILCIFINLFKALALLPKGGYLIADVVSTVSITMIFGLGGLIGTTMALAISNVISIALLTSMFKKKEV